MPRPQIFKEMVQPFEIPKLNQVVIVHIVSWSKIVIVVLPPDKINVDKKSNYIKEKE